jgi:hypothetical protein
MATPATAPTIGQEIRSDTQKIKQGVDQILGLIAASPPDQASEPTLAERMLTAMENMAASQERVLQSLEALHTRVAALGETKSMTSS